MGAETGVALDADVIPAPADGAVGGVGAEETGAFEGSVASIADVADNVADGSAAGDAVGDIAVGSLAQPRGLVDGVEGVDAVDANVGGGNCA